MIKVLQDNNLQGVAVSGQDANVAGLQNILLGWQTATVYKPVKDEADAAVEVAIALLSGEEVSTDAELEDVWRRRPVAVTSSRAPRHNLARRPRRVPTTRRTRPGR